jgi:hypothetical protein
MPVSEKHSSLFPIEPFTNSKLQALNSTVWRFLLMTNTPAYFHPTTYKEQVACSKVQNGLSATNTLAYPNFAQFLVMKRT